MAGAVLTPESAFTLNLSVAADYFTGAQNPHHADLLSTIQALQTDSDRDVRFFVCRNPESEGQIIPNMVCTTHRSHPT